MTIQEILRQHQISDNLNCECGYNYDQHNPNEETFEVIYTAHQAEVLDKHMQEREAQAKAEHRREWADYIENWQAMVGAPICHVDSVVQALRSDHVPFGKGAPDGR